MDEDELARLRAESQQVHVEVAAELWNFYSEILAKGFSASQAMALTVTFLQEQLRRAKRDTDE